MASMVQTEKRPLAAMGATRMSQKAGMDYMKGTGSLEYIYATLVEITSAGQTGCLGYALYQALDKKDYAKTMARITTNAQVQRLTVSSKGKVAEAIMGLGLLEQATHCKKLEGIMEIVVFLENSLLHRDKDEIMEEEEKVDAQINNADFATAIEDIHKKLD
eukprot:5799279-Heterocapsa_arctica.AAC.1